MNLYTILYSTVQGLQVVDYLGESMGWVEGFELLRFISSLQVADFIRALNSLNSSGYLYLYICTRRQSCAY